MRRLGIETVLDILLEDVESQPCEDAYREALDVASELEQARQHVSECERRYLEATNKLCGDLAIGIRRHQPGLNVSLGDGACRVAYLQKNLAFKPDIAKKMWNVDSSHPRFGSKFKHAHGPHISMDGGDMHSFAKSIADFFTGFYKSIGEDIKGTGTIVMDGRKLTYRQLVEAVQGSLLGQHLLAETA